MSDDPMSPVVGVLHAVGLALAVWGAMAAVVLWVTA